MIMHQWQWGWG